MGNPELVSQIPQHVHHAQHVIHHVAPHAHHVIKHATHHIKHVTHTGVKMLHLVIDTIVSLAVGFGLGWYIRGRGIKGVKTDLSNANSTVTKLAEDAQAKV